ncbi:MAG: ester cyclase family protein [Thermomicrobiales bacterium]
MHQDDIDQIGGSRRPALSRRAVLRALGAGGAVGLLAGMGHTARADDCPATTPEENVALVRRFFEDGVNRGDLDVFDTVVAPDIVYNGATVSDESGLDALKRIYGEALTGFPGIQYALQTSVSSGDTVALRFLVTGVHTGEFRGLPPTGDTITWNHSTFAHVVCGRVTEMWAEVNQLDRLRQFGTLAEAGPAAIMAGDSPAPAATPVAAAASSDCAPQSPEDVLAVVERLRTEVYNAGNTDALPEVVAEGYRHGSANGPDAVGIAAGGAQISSFLTAIPDLAWTFDEAIAQGDQAAARWTIRGTNDGEFFGLAATGQPVEYTGISFFTVQCGKITEFQTEMDAAGLLAQIGAPVMREP